MLSVLSTSWQQTSVLIVVAAAVTERSGGGARVRVSPLSGAPSLSPVGSVAA